MSSPPPHPLAAKLAAARQLGRGRGGFMSRQADLSPLPQLHHNQSASLHNLTVQEMGKNFFLFGAPPTFFLFLPLSLSFHRFFPNVSCTISRLAVVFYNSFLYLTLLYSIAFFLLICAGPWDFDEVFEK
jgi:hypothetical protein